jgi:predicted DNA-binding transcriptional regulator YafY
MTATCSGRRQFAAFDFPRVRAITTTRGREAGSAAAVTPPSCRTPLTNPDRKITRPSRVDVHALTGMDPADIDRIAALADPGYTRGRPPRFTHRDRVLLALVALRTNLTERALAAIFGISQSTAHRAIRDLVASISDLFVPGL